MSRPSPTVIFITACVVSGVVHGATAWAMHGTEPEEPPTAEVLTVDLVIAADPPIPVLPEPEPAVTQAEPEAVVEPRPERTPRSTPSSVDVPRRSSADAAFEPAPPPSEPETRETPATLDDVMRARTPTRLDPSSAAISSLEMPRRRATRASTASSSRAIDAEALRARVQADLTEAGNARAHLSERPPPRLRARTDGSYTFEGHAFAALIHPDGHVTFQDRPGVEVEGGPLGIGGRFDLTDAIQGSRGHDPYRHEKNWFMRETEELRDRLATRADRENERRGLRALTRELSALWAEGTSAVARRRALFERWDECADDDLGRTAKAAIEAFISQTLPTGSPDAFSAAELARLNRGRQSTEPFAPYAAGR